MKLSILSDLHLEFCEAPQLPGGDILAMAGDIFSAFSFDDVYCGNAVDFIISHYNIRLAIHGHTHHRVEDV